MDELIKQIVDKKLEDIYSLILHSRLSSEAYYLQTIPMFIAEENHFFTLQKYDIESETSNIFIKIRCTYLYIIICNIDTNSNKIYPENYLFISSVTFGIVVVIITLYWHISLKYHRNQVSSLQKILSALPYIKLFLSPMIIYYIKCANQTSHDPTALLVVVYMDTIISALWAIYKTVFWFLAVLVSSGWQMYKTELSRFEMRKFVVFYIFIYFFVCFDKIIDVMVNKNYWRVCI
jgi:hypothetical protein